jgi:hypothetical protein
MMIEGSGSGYGSIPLTSGSGSWRPKNMWIRLRNTAAKYGELMIRLRKVDPGEGRDRLDGQHCPAVLRIQDVYPGF